MMLLKSNLGIKCHSQYIKVIRLLQHSSNNSYNGCDWGCITFHLGTIIVLVLLAFSLMIQKSQHSITLPRSLFWVFATVTLMHNSHQIGVIGLTGQLILQDGKILRSVLKEQ